MKAKNIFNSKLAAAESNFNSAFDVIEKIQNTAEVAAFEASEEAIRAEIQLEIYRVKAAAMRSKMSFYDKRADKIRAFIKSLND